MFASYRQTKFGFCIFWLTILAESFMQVDLIQ